MKNKYLNIFLFDLVDPDFSEQEKDIRMNEFENLVNTYGGFVILKKIQRRNYPDYKTFIGKGKLEEIKNEMYTTGADLLIVGNNLKPGQIYNLNEYVKDIGANVWDRIDLILKIFGKHAQSTEARLQIELASIRHMGPRIYRMGMDLSRQGGGIGTRGKGETNVQLMKRHLRESEKKIRQKLEEYKKVRDIHRKGRANKNFNTVGIVGYTNAGKSSLLNSLSKKGVNAENKLFATLGTSVGKTFIWYDNYNGKEVLLNDTIGFIRDLPPSLIDAFSSTLEDSIQSNLLIHLIDATDNDIKNKIQIVNNILENIGANQNRLYVFNKIDELNKKQLNKLKSFYKKYDPIFISANKKIGLENLKKEIYEKLFEN